MSESFISVFLYQYLLISVLLPLFVDILVGLDSEIKTENKTITTKHICDGWNNGEQQRWLRERGKN